MKSDYAMDVAAALVIVVTVSHTTMAKPVGVHIGYQSSMADELSEGPGFGGAPVLVDTSSHMMNQYNNYNARQTGDITVRVRTQKSTPDINPDLPIIRPATNINPGHSMPVAGHRTSSIIYELLARKLEFIMALAGRQEDAYNESNLYPQKETEVNINIQKREPNVNVLQSNPTALRLALARSTSNEDILPLIRPSTHSESLPVIRPATNV